MWKPMLAGTVVLVLSGSSPVLAQRPVPATPQTTPSAPAAPSATPATKATPQKSDAAKEDSSAEGRADAKWREQQAEDLAELEGRLASLKVRLKLTDDQTKNWPAFETALRDFVKSRMEMRHDFRTRERSDNPLENMQARADYAVRRGTAMKDFVTAARPLYDSLDEKQQRQFRRSALRGVMMMLMQRGHGRHGFCPRFWRDRSDYGWGDGPRWSGRGGGDWGYDRRWRDRDGDSDWGEGPRWGGRRGDNDDGCYRRHGWHHRGESRDGMMSQRWSGRDRGDYRDRGGDDDDRGGSVDEQSYTDHGDNNFGGRKGSRALKPYEERL